MSVPRYPEYKDSGVEWLGDVPAHWDVCLLKRKFRSVDYGISDALALEGMVAVLRMGNIENGKVVTDDLKYTDAVGASLLLARGDLLYNRTNSLDLVGKVGLFTGSCGTPVSFASYLVRLRVVDECLPEYFAYLLNSGGILGFARANAFVAIGQCNLSPSRYGQIPVAVPPRSEQVSIAAFLDRETAKIDALVAEQQRLIELLKEKRQAVISHAVTKGLNPDAPMKPSGVEWLGDVPVHWRVVPLGKVTTSRCDGPFGSGLKSEHYTDSGVRVIRLQNIRRDGFLGTDEAFIDADYYERELSGHDVVAGDVLIAGLGDDNNTVGRACVAPRGIEPAMVKADCFRFRLDRAQATPEFVATALSAGAAADAGVLSSGSTRSRIPLSVMATRKLALPPVAEQEEIASYLSAAALKFDTLITEAQRAIDLLQERRAALISAAVTGQIDVRAIADRVAA